MPNNARVVVAAVVRRAEELFLRIGVQAAVIDGIDSVGAARLRGELEERGHVAFRRQLEYRAVFPFAQAGFAIP
jgi:hypothetical protein